MDAKRPYTRKAVRAHKKDFIRGGIPGSKLHIFEAGNKKGTFDTEVSILPNSNTIVRHNALEAGRIAGTAYMKKNLEDTNYHVKIRVYPHHILRAHAQAAVAQADRFYQGMSHPFGKPVGVSARVRKEQPIMTIRCNKKDVKFAKEAMRRTSAKIPGATRVEVISK